jgi:hypothetical protein
MAGARRPSSGPAGVEFGRYFATEAASGEARGRRLAPRARGSRHGRGPGNKQLNNQPVFH